MYRQIPAYYMHLIKTPDMNPHNLLSLRPLFASLPADYGLRFDVLDRDLNRLANSGFFKNQLIQKMKSIGFWMRPSDFPTCLDWDLFVERIVFGFPNTHLTMNYFAKCWADDERAHGHNKVGEILLERIVKKFLTSNDISGLAKSLSLPLSDRYDDLLLGMKPSIANATPFFIRTRDYFALFGEPTDVYFVENERLHEALTIINHKGDEGHSTGGTIVLVRGRILTPYYDEFAE